MTADFLIRVAQSRDIRIIQEIFRDEGRAVISDNLFVTNFDQAADFLNPVWLVAEAKGNQVVGFGSISFERTVRGGMIGHIEDVIVKEFSRRAGIGGKVVHEAIAQAEEHGCYKIILGAETGNETFYKDLGFSAAGILFCKYVGDGRSQI